ncbi:translation factor Sua5, partial [Candidatus Falkowbacteria bacterium]|nr:translation factor Sua5 [Candidatus Falkowbacteria bacterium]
KMIKKADAPVVSTSLNISGKKGLEDVTDMEKHFKGVSPDLLVEIGRKLKGKPSKLIDIEDKDTVRILRK